MAQDKALRKRQQISKANRMMFMAVAAASVVIGIAVVVALFLGQKLLFNEKVLGEKQKTISVLQENNKNASLLKENVAVLNTNQDLKDSLANPDDNAPLRVILDALPAEANSSAFGASLQKVLLAGEGISVDTLSINPVAGIEASDADTATDSTVVTSENSIGFSFSVSTASGNGDSMQTLLRRLERSIRIVKLLNYEIERQGNRLVLKGSAEAYYQPEKKVTLMDKVVQP